MKNKSEQQLIDHALDESPPTWRENIRWWFRDRWDDLILKLYRTTNHYTEVQMHEMFLHDLLDKMGAPRLYRATNHYTEAQMREMFLHDLLDKMGAPRRPPKVHPDFGPYGRLKAWAVERGIKDEKEI